MDITVIGDIIIFAALAAFIFIKLRSVLGQHDDTIPPKGGMFGDKPEGQAEQPREGVLGAGMKKAKAAEKAPEPVVIEDVTVENPKMAKVMEAIKAKDKHFTVSQFLAGANAAFEMVMEAFNAGDKKTLQQLLEPQLYRAYEEELKKRAAQKQVEKTTLVAIVSSEIQGAAMRGNVAEITIEFISEQVFTAVDKDGNVIEEKSARMEDIDDIWTFQRDVSSSNPNWTITGT